MKIIDLIIATVFFGCGVDNHKTEQPASSTVIEKADESYRISDISKSDTLVVTDKKSKIPSNSIRMKIFKNTDVKGYGYDILMGNDPYIHQPNIPGLSGNEGFRTEEDAMKVATLILHKINNNIIPPTVEIKELDSLEIHH